MGTAPHRRCSIYGKARDSPFIEPEDWSSMFFERILKEDITVSESQHAPFSTVTGYELQEHGPMDFPRVKLSKCLVDSSPT
jgi:hypothetical protein